jgi:type II secretion system protein L
MTTLRVFLDAPPDAGRDAEWALYGDNQELLSAERGALSQWPSADAKELVIAAGLGRLVSLTLPPLPPTRALSAARFALEDQLAGAPEDSHVAVAGQAGDGSIRAAVVDTTLMRAFMAASTREGLHWRRIILESDLARPPENGWCWCAQTAAHSGFVRTQNGASLATSPAVAPSLPEELELALARSGGSAPRVVRIDVAGIAPEALAHAREKFGTEMILGRAWDWRDAPPNAFSSAIDLQSGDFDEVDTRPRVDASRLLRPALWIALFAIALHLIAAAGRWGFLQWQSAAAQRDLTAIARIAAPGPLAETAPATAIAQRDAEVRHAAGMTARDDLVPLLARASSALATLPSGAIKSLRYADGHIVFELQHFDPAQTSRVQRELQQAGLVALAVPTTAGGRLRVGFD